MGTERGVKMSIDFKELEYGFKYGDATIERHISDEKKVGLFWV